MAGGGVAALGVHTERAAQYKGRMTLAVAMTCLVAAGRWPAPQSFRQPRTHRPLAPRRRALGGGQV